jgi:glycosyltransferase involved in cell wall biosynthesis
MKVSVLIPCYNEVNTIELIVHKIRELNNIDLEIIVINDHSSDGTEQILKERLNNKIDLIINNEENHGKGYCIRKGIKAAKGEIILIQDADLEYDPSDYYKILNPIINNKADIVYGTRFFGGTERRIHFFWHTYANKLLTFFCNIKTNLNLSDMECGFKVFKKKCLNEIDLTEDRFGFEPEITIKLARKKFLFYEVGISYYGRSYEEGKKIGFKDALRAMYVILFK